MKNMLLAAAVISLGVAGTANAATPDAEIGFKNDGQSLVAPAGHRCYYRYFYVSNGYQYRYFYRYYCY